MSDLKDKLSEVKDQHAAEIVEQRAVEASEKAKLEAAFILGRVKQNDHIAQAIATNLGSQTIMALERFQEEKKFKALGFDTFDQFLDNSDLSPMTKTQYYTRRQMMNAHTPEVFDLLTAVGISMRSQKMLVGEIAIRGDKLVIGDDEVDVSASGGMLKEAIEKIVDEKRELQTKLAKAEKKVEDQAEKLSRGEQDFEQLQRNFDALRESNPYERMLARTLTNLLELTEHIGDLPDKKKSSAGVNAMPLLWEAIRRVRSSYGTTFTFEDVDSPTTSSDLDDIARQVLAGGDDLDDE